MRTATAKRATGKQPHEPPLTLRLRPVLELDEEQFFMLCQFNGDLRIERNSEGELLIMSPTGWETGDRELEAGMQLRQWAKREGSGVASGASTGFILPNTAMRAPDAAWTLKVRLEKVSAAQRQRFLPLCPDFVLEIRSPSDRLIDLQAKMKEYLANGARLGWLLDPETRHLYVYRPGAPVQRLDNPETVAGDPELPGFVLDLREIW